MVTGYWVLGIPSFLSVWSLREVMATKLSQEYISNVDCHASRGSARNDSFFYFLVPAPSSLVPFSSLRHSDTSSHSGTSSYSTPWSLSPDSPYLAREPSLLEDEDERHRQQQHEHAHVYGQPMLDTEDQRLQGQARGSLEGIVVADEIGNRGRHPVVEFDEEPPGALVRRMRSRNFCRRITSGAR